MASPDTKPGRGVLFSSSLSGDRILRNVQRDVARREGYAIIEDDAPLLSDGRPRLNFLPRVTDPILGKVWKAVAREERQKSHR